MRKMSSFTLIELLVVVAVIMILTAILLPALNSARNTVKRITCSSNIRNIYQGCVMYVNDSGGWMPPTTTNAQYAYHTRTYLRVSPEKDGGQVVDALEILEFKKTQGVYFCPNAPVHAYDSICWNGGDGTEASYFYSMYVPSINNPGDTQCGGWLYSPSGSVYKYRRFESIKAASAIMTENNYSGISGVMNQPSALWCSSGIASTNRYPDKTIPSAPGFNYHARSANFLFVDGHVKAYKYTGVAFLDANVVPLK